MTDRREVVLRLRSGESVRRIARELGLSRNTVRRYRQKALVLGLMDPAVPMPPLETFAVRWRDGEDQRPPRVRSKVEPHRELVPALVDSGVDATVIHRRLVEDEGFDGSYGSVLRYIQRLRPVESAVTPRVETPPGEEAQVDFGFLGYLKATETAKPRKAWLFLMTLSHSRHAFGWLVQDQSAATWQDLHRRAFEFFGAVPRVVVCDNLKAAIVRAAFDRPEGQRGYRECAEHYGFRILPARVRKPKDKAKVERGIQYVRRSFWRVRDYELLADANQALSRWLLEVAGQRVHGTTRRKPLEVFEAVERPAMLPLPRTRWEPLSYKLAKLHPDSHVQFNRAYYSAPCRLIGKQLLVQASSRQVALFFDHQLVASHLVVAPGGRRTCPDHLPPHKVRFYTQTPQWCRTRAHEIGPFTTEVVENLLGERPMDRLRAVQGILQLAERFTLRRLEAACARALHFDDLRRKTLRNILDQGLDFEPLPESRRVRVLPFPRFTRTAHEIFQRR